MQMNIVASNSGQHIWAVFSEKQQNTAAEGN